MWSIIHFDEIHSTQAYAKENNLSPYTIVKANHQTAGVGQYGRVWEDQNQSIMLTAVFPLPQMAAALFTQYIALHMIEQLCAYCEDIQIKWPNDLVIGRKKLGGILTEVSGNVMYVGIGLNVQNPSVPTGIGLLQATMTDDVYQSVLECVIKALKQPIIEDMQRLEAKHVYCQSGVYIEKEHHAEVHILPSGSLQVGEKAFVDSQSFDLYYK